MGTYYDVYAEVKVGNKWYNLNPLFTRDDGRIYVCPVVSGQSWLRDAYDELEEYKYSTGRPNDLSKELKTVFTHDNDEPLNDGYDKSTYEDWYEQSIFLVNYGKSVKSRVKKDRKHRYQGYASKHSIANYEIGDCETINHWLSENEYEKLSPKQKLNYSYYEWSDWGDWYDVYNTIVTKLDSMLDYFYDWADCTLYGSANLDEVRPTADYVRLIVFRH